jgi:hypothetical protein
MTAVDLIDDLISRGVRFEVTKGRLRVNAPAGALGDSDREALARHKPALLELLTLPPVVLPFARPPAPTPPRGATLYYQNDKGQPCQAEHAYMWTWAGGPTWYYSRDYPPPGTPRVEQAELGGGVRGA